jgi:hypothetical protein
MMDTSLESKREIWEMRVKWSAGTSKKRLIAMVTSWKRS